MNNNDPQGPTSAVCYFCFYFYIFLGRACHAVFVLSTVLRAASGGLTDHIYAPPTQLKGALLFGVTVFKLRVTRRLMCRAQVAFLIVLLFARSNSVASGPRC